jgi:hypothetical protein
LERAVRQLLGAEDWDEELSGVPAGADLLCWVLAAAVSVGAYEIARREWRRVRSGPALPGVPLMGAMP